MEREQSNPAPSRRRLGALLAGGAALALPAISLPVNAEPLNSDDRILSIEAEIDRLLETIRVNEVETVDPYHNEFSRLLKSGAMEDAFRYSKETGHHAAVDADHAMWIEVDRLFLVALAMPSQTARGRAAKIRLLMRCYASKLIGPHSDLDWEWQVTRALLGDFAGVSQDELSAVRHRLDRPVSEMRGGADV